MRNMGFAEADIKAALAARPGAAQTREAQGGAGLWPWHAKPFSAFLAARNQWRLAPVGLAGFLVFGLDHAGVEASFRLNEITLTRQEFADFEVIAGEAARLLNTSLQARSK